jgi:hypothetical protein
LFTVNESGEDVEPAKPELPEYTAVKERAPVDSMLMVNVATPDALRFTIPSNVEPSKKLTVPSADPFGIGMTEAVRATDCEEIAGLGLTSSEVLVVVGARVEMTSVIGAEVDVAKLAFPE